MNARDAALHELDARSLPHWPGGRIRSRRSDRAHEMDPRDRALAEQITLGVIKNLLLLQRLIEHHSDRNLVSIDELTQKILSIGLYQLRFLTRIPPSAAVDQAVEQAKRYGRRRASGFVNAVLRNASRDADPTDLPPTVRWSHPADLMTRLEARVGRDKLEALCQHNNAEPPTIVRLLPGRTPGELETPGVDILPHERAGMFVVTGARRAELARWAGERIAQVQDPTSAGVVDAMDLRPGHTVLDRCAGLGTKSFQILERIGVTGTLLAVDPSDYRSRALSHAAAERNAANLLVRSIAFLRELAPDDPVPRLFDRVLVDAPCSNSGVLSRRPEARYAQGDRALRSLKALQLDILRDTIAHVADGGLLVYSTCSIWPDENDDLVREFISEFPGSTLLEERQTLPSFDASPSQHPQRYHDGGYFAVVRRDASNRATPT